MAILATGSKTIIDLSDGKSLSAYLGSSQPRTQIHDVNASTYTPDWTTTPGRLTITPVVYANQTAVALDNPALSITWKRKEGSGSEASLTTGEAVSENTLIVSQNKLAAVTSGLLSYIAYVTYTDPDTGLPINATADITFAKIDTGEHAKSAWIAGEQVFKYAISGGSPSPTQITLIANLQNVSMSKWQFKNGSGTWTDYPTTADNATITGTSVIVKPAHDIWVSDVATLRIVTSDLNIGDTTSIYKVADGATGGTGTPGAPASVAFLSNENMSFAGNAAGQVSAVTVTANVVAYTGTTKITPTVGTVTGAPTGMTVNKGSAVNNEIPLSIVITANATLGGSGPMQGTLSVPVTAPVNTTLTISWSKINVGATGASGQNAVVFSLYAPSGTVFTNHSGMLTIQVAAYDGATDISGTASFAWQKYASGSWNGVGGSTASLSVDGSAVEGLATYRCTMTYNSKQYTDCITLIDKTDNYQADVDSTAGDYFKNTVGTTCLVCRLWQNGTEVDPLKSTTFSQTAPSSPSTGAFYYKITPTAPATALMRYSGSAWEDVTANATYKHTRTYKWYRRDKNGSPLDAGAVFAVGKVIYVDGDDVDVKTVFVCEVA